MPLSGGEPRHLTAGSYSGAAWTADGRELVFSRGSELWRISAAGGKPYRLGITNARFPSLSRQGDRLAYERETSDTDIWRAQVSGGAAQMLTPTALIASTRNDTAPDISPDGDRLVFASNRMGNMNLWICDIDGSSPVQLTALDAAGSPQWSPKGRFIAFDRPHEGQSDIYIIQREGGQLTRLTTDPADDVVPSWSRNGRWIYFASRRSGDWQVWKMEAEGGQTPVQVTQQGGFAPQESADGESVYYVKGLDVPGIWKVPVAGGEETMILEQSQAGFWGWWVVVEKGIYFLNTEVAPWPAIEFFDFATEKTTPIVQLSGSPRKWQRSLAVSPDETWFLYTQTKPEACDLMLVENFR